MRQLSLFDVDEIEKSAIEPAELFKAYFDCRRNKRNTLNALAFESDYESNLLELCDELNDGSFLSIACLLGLSQQRYITHHRKSSEEQLQ